LRDYRGRLDQGTESWKQNEASNDSKHWDNSLQKAPDRGDSRVLGYTGNGAGVVQAYAAMPFFLNSSIALWDFSIGATPMPVNTCGDLVN
jgi:hypothetical protein